MKIYDQLRSFKHFNHKPGIDICLSGILTGPGVPGGTLKPSGLGPSIPGVAGGNA